MLRYRPTPEGPREMTWRDILGPIIRRVLRETAGQDERAIRKALREAYTEACLGPRKHWPYRVYLDEIARQRGLKKRKTGTADAVPEGQLTLEAEE